MRLGLATGRGHGELIKRTVWLRMGVPVDGGPGGGGDRLAGHRIHRRGGDRRTLRPVARLYLALRRGALLAVVATGAYRRVERTAIVIGLFELAFFAVAWAAHPNLRDLGEGCARPARRQPRIHVSGGGGDRRDLQSLDDLLSTVRHRRQKASARSPHRRPLGYGVRRGADPVLDRRGAGRRGGDAGLRRRLGGPKQRRRDQRRAVAASRGEFRPSGVQRRRARRLHGGRHRVLAGAGLGVGEVAGYRRSLEYHPFEAKWFYGVYAAAVVGSAALVWFAPDLVGSRSRRRF